MRKPYPSAPAFRTSFDIAGVSTLKFMPKVATSATTATASRTMGVSRT